MRTSVLMLLLFVLTGLMATAGGCAAPTPAPETHSEPATQFLSQPRLNP